MTFKEELAQALRHQRVLMKHRPDRWHVQGAIYLGWWLGFGWFFAIVNGISNGRLGAAAWWRGDLPGHLLVSACVTSAFFVAFRGFETLAPQRWLSAINGWRDWRSGVFFAGMSIGCSLVGVIVGLMLVGHIWIQRDLSRLLMAPAFWREFVTVSALITLFMTLRYRARWKQEALQARVNEAQLKLLQGQIEPHFLFNTLANVQSLIDFDPARAKLMLERFTDYLRASLGQLRGEASTLTQEFAMLEAYLGLMQLRMGDRLRVDLTLPADLRAVEVPPLLVQPLVENAIHHGLEPQIAGGTVQVRAWAADGRLHLEVADDGQGLDAPKRRPGNGVALGNIRARLQARFGPTAQLTLSPREGGGTCARLEFPFTPATP